MDMAAGRLSHHHGHTLSEGALVVGVRCERPNVEQPFGPTSCADFQVVTRAALAFVGAKIGFGQRKALAEQIIGRSLDHAKCLSIGEVATIIRRLT